MESVLRWLTAVLTDIDPATAATVTLVDLKDGKLIATYLHYIDPQLWSQDADWDQICAGL